MNYKLKFFPKPPKTADHLVTHVLLETENDFGISALRLLGSKLRLACAAYEFVMTMSAQHVTDQPISEWIDRWDQIQQAIDTKGTI